VNRRKVVRVDKSELQARLNAPDLRDWQLVSHVVESYGPMHVHVIVFEKEGE
jgi:hypothetical protein